MLEKGGTFIVLLVIVFGATGLVATPLSGKDLLPSLTVTPAESLYPSTSDRFGVGVNPGYGDAGDFDVARLKAGWYVDWRTQLAPTYPAGLDYMHIVDVSGGSFSPDEATLAEIAAANPGATWIIGNEPDCIWQGSSTPDQYARVYHRLHTLLKSRDPTCRVTIGGVVQVTDLRLQWLDAVLEIYQTHYGEPLPTDLWNIHTFILQEKSCAVYPFDCWGAEIPPGINAHKGVEWGMDDHDNMSYFAEQIVRFRQWMKDRGERDKELIVSEYGILMPDTFGFDEPRVQAFMISTFDYLMTATDPELGHPADGNRLVQRWAWYSLNDKRFEGHTSHSHLFEPSSKEITALGIDFGNYVTPLYTSYVDLAPAAVTFSPPQPLALDNQPITVTVTAMARNAGNTDSANVSIRLWVDDPDHAIGEEQTITALPARSLGSVSVEWQNVLPGLHTVGVTVDVEDSVDESNEENNQSSYNLLIARYATFLPLIAQEW